MNCYCVHSYWCIFLTQLTVEAYDTLRPTVRGKVIVEITVVRNPNPPSWGLPGYTASVREDATPISDVKQIQAVDLDPNVSFTEAIFIYSV